MPKAFQPTAVKNIGQPIVFNDQIIPAYYYIILYCTHLNSPVPTPPRRTSVTRHVLIAAARLLSRGR